MISASRLFKALTAAALGAVGPAHGAVSFDIDFSGAVAFYDETENSLRIDVQDIAVGPGAPLIDLRISSITNYAPRDDGNNAATGLANNGTPAGTDDLRIHIGNGTSTDFLFTLYDGTNPGSYTTLFDPGDDFSFSLISYDIDGNSTADSGADTLTIVGPHSYALSQNSSVVPTVGANSITYDADGVGEVDGQAGIQDFVTDPQQEPVSVLFTFQNVNQFQFTYGSEVYNPNVGTGRNLLLDGNDITLSDFTNPQTGSIPEPSSLIMALFGFLLLTRRDRS